MQRIPLFDLALTKMSNESYFRFDDESKSTYKFKIIIDETGKLKTHSSIYCIKDNWKKVM